MDDLMFGFFKRLFSHSVPEPAAPVPEALAPVAPPAPLAPPALTMPVAPPRPIGDAIQVPFSDIVARLSGGLAPLSSVPLTGTFPLPVQTALAQLPSGAVRVRFAQIRQAAPPGTFSDDTSLDETLVDLPLPKVLAAMNPALLSRRAGQKQVEVPKEVTGVFKTENRASVWITPPSAAPVAPKPVPIVPTRARAPIATPAPTTVPAPAPLARASAGGALTVQLSSLYEFWPESIRQDIAQFNWGDASVALPMDRIGSAMKTGRVFFTWGELMQWLDVSSASVASPHRETALELPLKVVAPLFMSQRSSQVVQKTVAVDENIPNLFAAPGKPAVQAVPASVPLTVPMPAPVPVSVPVSVPEVVAAVPGDVLGEIFGQPAKKEWSPQEITQKINVLPGVAASLIAMSDGLLVAGDLPPPLKSETMAAFLPQMFGRLAHYSKEIQLGPPTALTLLVGQTPCSIFKTGALYLAVLGKPGETLPGALLQRVAVELAQRNL
jgi:predicted regulator of Ras-like GTPase activity (Roadblock/LC7/MglB family)